MKEDVFADLRIALKNNDVHSVTESIRILALNKQVAHLNELTRAKMWLASKAILDHDFSLAQEMYKPFDSALPLQQMLVLPNLNEANLEKIVPLSANWSELILLWAYCYWRKGDFRETKRVLSKLVADFQDNRLGHTVCELYCDSLCRMGGLANFSEIENICQSLAQPEQQYRYPFVYLGAAKFFQRHQSSNKKKLFNWQLFSKKRSNILFYEAINLFNEAAKRPQGLIHVSCGCLSVINPETIQQDLNELKIEQAIFDRSNDYSTVQTSQAIVFFACDSVYLREYALLLVASVARLNKNTVTICHVHIVDPDQDSFAIVEEIRRLVPQVRLNLSTEKINSAQKKPYYASARFIRAIELLDLYHVPLFVVDTDMVIEISIEELVRITQGNDVGLIVRTGSASFPWTEVQAGTAFFSDSKNSRRFLELTKHAILTKLYEAGNAAQIWYVDQNALFSVYWLMKNELTICNLLSPPQKLIYSCYSRTVNRQQFTNMKLSEYGVQPLDLENIESNRKSNGHLIETNKVPTFAECCNEMV